MSRLAIGPVLRESLDEVLEKMFFIQALGPGAEEPATAPVLAARLAFDGNSSGTLTLQVSEAAARSIAVDFLGIDEEELSQGQVAEVLCEFANMVCGSVLSRVESSAVFHLAEPRIVQPAEGGARDPDDAFHSVELPNGTLTVILTTERPACLEPAESVS